MNNTTTPAETCPVTGCTNASYGHGYGPLCLHHNWIARIEYVESIRTAHATGEARALLDSVSTYGPNKAYISHGTRTALWGCAMTLTYRDKSAYAISEAAHLVPILIDSLARDVERWAEDMGLRGPMQRWAA